MDRYRFKFKKYINSQLVVCIALLTFTTAFFSYFHLIDKWVVLTFVLLSLINCGALLEQRKWIYYLECLRLMLVVAYVFYQFDLLSLIFIPLIILIVLERTFSLSSVYRNYVLQYEKIE